MSLPQQLQYHENIFDTQSQNTLFDSVSFGATRRFDFKHKTDPSNKFSLELHSGSVLLMQGDMQHHWLHQLPAQKRILTPRINLTFRFIH